MTEPARIAASSLYFMEIPAGMLDDERNIKSAALKEIQEEVGIFPKADELIDMTKLAVQDHKVPGDIQSVMYPSPGDCDEFISIVLWEKEPDRLDRENLKNRLMGDGAALERITIRLLEYEKLVAVGARDGKMLAAWSLYEYLKKIHLEHLLEHELYLGETGLNFRATLISKDRDSERGNILHPRSVIFQVFTCFS
jgi:ADP-sugar diphosphatase